MRGLGLYPVVIAGFIGSIVALVIIFRELGRSEIALETFLLWIPSIVSAYICKIAFWTCTADHHSAIPRRNRLFKKAIDSLSNRSEPKDL